MIVIGLTGSIGMGKTTVGAMLATCGVPVHEADHAVHNLLSDKHGLAYKAICTAFPYFNYPQIYKNKTLDRKALSAIIFADDAARNKLESILHPLVRKDQGAFIRQHKRAECDMVALDIPLLFETGAEERVDFTIVVSAPANIQRARVLARDNMNEEKFHDIVSKQMPDAQKRARANYVIQTGLGRAETLKQIQQTLKSIKNDNNNT